MLYPGTPAICDREVTTQVSLINRRRGAPGVHPEDTGSMPFMHRGRVTKD